MRLFPKILTVTLSLIAAGFILGLATPSAPSVVADQRTVSAPNVASVNARHVGATHPFVAPYATDSESFGEQAVIAYLDGVARQERADAEAAAQDRGHEVSSSPTPITVPGPMLAEPAPPAPYVGGIHAQPFLICVRRHESDRADVNGNGLFDGGYQAKNPNSSAAGAYQYLLSTWLSVVSAMGHPEWAGDPRDFSDDIQDQVAWWTYQNQGAGPWSGSGCD